MCAFLSTDPRSRSTATETPSFSLPQPPRETNQPHPPTTPQPGPNDNILVDAHARQWLSTTSPPAHRCRNPMSE
ncbi:hypothetical protein K504DRAFT_460359 [Pleomassaria siparia CBS 279.74]|uniref:Uncharacterized protein n=1 Tax=Pleomassaria siparia CBS 279.74 TaxID=1314801 RepID=A0A6G1JZE8_9PLEO|nr:hypothetical protein K504DRAFT_460359 [Pleomassaria siparia CBS 279.74]